MICHEHNMELQKIQDDHDPRGFCYYCPHCVMVYMIDQVILNHGKDNGVCDAVNVIVKTMRR